MIAYRRFLLVNLWWREIDSYTYCFYILYLFSYRRQFLKTSASGEKSRLQRSNRIIIGLGDARYLLARLTEMIEPSFNTAVELLALRENFASVFADRKLLPAIRD